MPTNMVVGETELSLGELASLLSTVTLDAAEVPPPGLGLARTMGMVPTVERSVALRVTKSWVLPRSAVGRAEPFTEAVVLLTKPVPVTVMLAAVDPAATEAGATLTIAGAGLLTVNVRGDEV